LSPGPVVTVGEALASLEPAEGRLDVAAQLALGTLGAEYNYAIDLSRLGVATQFFGAVGADPLGRRVIRTARAEGVDVTGVVVDPARPTGLLLKDTPGMDGERAIYYIRGGSAASAFAPTEALTAAADVALGVHVSGISFCLGPALRESALALLKAGAGARWRSFDVNVRLRLAPPEQWAAALAQALPFVTTIFATAGELGSAGLDLDDVVSRARSQGVSCVIRCGREKTLIVAEDGSKERVVPTYSTNAIDPVGTGDAFAAAVTSYRLADAPWSEAVRAGHLAGAMVASVRGDFEGAPYLEELRSWVDGHHVNR
jgi:2-dehydro-3-deoxygluconokinase